MNAPLLPRTLPVTRQLLLPMRLDVSSVVRIELPDDEELICATETLSRRELVISCNQETLMRILPKGRTAHGERRSVKGTFFLPIAADETTGHGEHRHLVHCSLEVHACRRVAQNRFLVQLRFAGLSLAHLAAIEAYIQQHKGGSESR